MLRSDDDGATWQDILAYRGGNGQLACTEVGDWNIRVAHLVYDPTDPNRLFVARVAADPHTQSVMTSGVTMTRDAGSSWTDLASQQMGSIADLALGPERDSLYVATDQGVWRLELS